jgi:hypothetical protein
MDSLTTRMTIYSLVRYNRGLGSQGEHDDFNDTVNNDFLVKHFEDKVNRINNVSDSTVLYIQRLIVNPDGTPKLDSEQRHQFKSIYVDKQYLIELSNI